MTALRRSLILAAATLAAVSNAEDQSITELFEWFTEVDSAEFCAALIVSKKNIQDSQMELLKSQLILSELGQEAVKQGALTKKIKAADKREQWTQERTIYYRLEKVANDLIDNRPFSAYGACKDALFELKTFTNNAVQQAMLLDLLQRNAGLLNTVQQSIESFSELVAAKATSEKPKRWMFKDDAKEGQSVLNEFCEYNWEQVTKLRLDDYQLIMFLQGLSADIQALDIQNKREMAHQVQRLSENGSIEREIKKSGVTKKQIEKRYKSFVDYYQSSNENRNAKLSSVQSEILKIGKKEFAAFQKVICETAKKAYAAAAPASPPTSKPSTNAAGSLGYAISALITIIAVILNVVA